MDEQRPYSYEDEAGEAGYGQPEPVIDPVVVDRLAAYGQTSEQHAVDVPDLADEPAPAQPVVPEPEPVSMTEPDLAFDPQPEPETQPEPQPMPELELEPGFEPEPELETEPEPALLVVDDPARSRRFGRRRPAERATRAPKERKDKRAKKVVGLKIGASQLAAAQVVNNGAPELIEVFREPLEPGLVVSGEIRDPDSLGDAIKRFFELHKLPKRGVRLGVSNNRIGVRIFEIEGVADSQQLENAIRFRAEEVLPIPLDEAVLDYVVLDEHERDDGTTWKRILLVVAYREVVDRYLQACRRAGLQVAGIDLEAFALLRSLDAPGQRDEAAGALVAVAIGHDRTTIAVSTGVHCEFARVLDWGGWSLNIAVARELDRAPSEVESIKRHLSFAHTTEVDGLTPEQVAKSRDGIQRALGAFARELISSLQFYQAQPGALGIGEVVLTGGTAHMDGFVDAVGEAIGVPVRLGDPFRRVKVGPHVGHEEQHGSLAIAIGLGIDD